MFPPSSGGVGRLEIQDMRGRYLFYFNHYLSQYGERKFLSSCSLCCLQENMSAFCVETQDRTMVFAALKEDCVGWVEKLCHSTFQRGVGSDSNQLQMEQNQIYASADEASQFWVTVQRTDAATRCGLKGCYWLQVGQEALLLRETEKKSIVSEWSYELLRRYGKDKLAFTIEVGRRCDSGPGTFTFETQQADTLFSLIQSTINRKTLTLGNQNQEGEKVIVAKIQAHSPLHKIPDVTSTAGILENKLGTQGSKSAALQESAHAHEDLVGLSESVSGQPAPITLMPLPLVPTHGSHSGGHPGGQSEAVYADPADCIQFVPKIQPTMALYVDPASVLPLKPPSTREAITPPPKFRAPPPRVPIGHPDPVYSEVYDKISPVKNKQTEIQSKGKVGRFADDEPIYTEPMGKKDKVSLKNESKPDPFAHLYAQVCKTTPSLSLSASSNTIPSCSSSPTPPPASMSTTEASDQSLDDVIYENLGII
uniref:IRS-type PTB domain-containing protein n=1 Tax=Cyclopterus lumpus TaxID=8103 RepID=A0A8C3ALH6_CYCLU